jgi:hypothetical protein
MPIKPSSSSQLIDVYPVVSPRFLAGHKDEIGRVLGMKAAAEGNRILHISTLSGGVTYFDIEQLWTNNNPGALPRSAAEVAKIAKNYLDRVRQNVEKLSEPTRFNLRNLFPTFPKAPDEVICTYAYAWDKNFPDHWLVRFGAKLATGIVTPQVVGMLQSAGPALASADPNRIPIALGEVTQIPSASAPEFTTLQLPDLAPVDGGLVDIRIGAGGKVIGLVSRWLAHLPPISAKLLAPPKQPDQPHEPKPKICYRIGGDNEPQEFVAPYYSILSSDGDTGEYVPASNHSLLVRIAQQGDETSVLLTALAAGSLGSLRYAWGGWRLDQGASGFRRLGGASSLRLADPGIHNIVVDVEDTVTKAFARAQVMVYWPIAQGTLE